MNTRILVWDLPTRLFHWLFALSFAIAFLTAESERWRDVHVLAGYVLLGLLAFRLLWGFAGSRYARFAQFVRSPRGILDYARSLLRGQPRHYLGHNPLGAVAIVGLLALGLVSGGSGWLLYEEIGDEWMEELHETASNAMLALVVLHIAGVGLASWLHRENLLGAMITGRKRGPARDGIPDARGRAAAVLGLVLAGSVGWGWSGSANENRDPEATDELEAESYETEDEADAEAE